jgi:hypothetical protein
MLAIVGAVFTVVLIVLGYKNKEKVKKVFNDSEFRVAVLGNDQFKSALKESSVAVGKAAWFMTKCSGKLVYSVTCAALQVGSEKKPESNPQVIVVK